MDRLLRCPIRLPESGLSYLSSWGREEPVVRQRLYPPRNCQSASDTGFLP